MKANEMTNEILAENLEATIPFLMKEARHITDADEIMIEAAARLRNVTIHSDNSKVIDELQRRLKIAEDALEKCVRVQCSGDDDSISCEECDLACDGRCPQWMAKNALNVIQNEGGVK